MNQRHSFRAIGLMTLLGLGTALHAQTPPSPTEPVQVVHLSASAYKEVPQDWLTVVVHTSLEGVDAVALQEQLQSVLERALAGLRPQVTPQDLEVHTGRFGIQPRQDERGRLVGWLAEADLVIEGRDFAKVSKAAAQVPRMTVTHTSFSLSRQARQQLETEVQGQAVQQFRQRAQQLAVDFGFAGYSLRQVTVGSSNVPDPGLRAYPVPASLMVGAEQVPVAAGKEEVRLTVSGSVQLR